MIGSIFMFSWLSVTCVDYAWTSKLRNKCIKDTFNKLKENDYRVYEDNKEKIYNSLKSYAKYTKGLDETDNEILYLSSIPLLNLAILKKFINKEYKEYFDNLSNIALEERFLEENHIITNKEYKERYESKVIYKDDVETIPFVDYSRSLNKTKKRVLKK